MQLSLNTKRNLWSIFSSVAGWVVAVFVSIWAVAETPLDADHVIESVIGGMLGGVGSVMVARNLHRHARKFTAGQTLLIRTFAYTLMIAVLAAVMAALRSPLVSDVGVLDSLATPEFREFLLGGQLFTIVAILFAGSLIINLFLQIQRMLGPGVLLKLLFGTYLRPVEEDRIFMFIDLTDSTAIAESLGARRFTDFKNDFFYDLAEPVLRTGGEVFQYVGDEAVLTWRTHTGLRNANWVRCYFFLCEKVTESHDRYMDRYGMIPKFKAGCHGGLVVTTEVGDLKRTIVHSGDVVNVAARIQQESKRIGRSLLVSGSLLHQTQLGEGFVAEDIGTFELRGKSDTVQLWSVDLKQRTE